MAGGNDLRIKVVAHLNEELSTKALQSELDKIAKNLKLNIGVDPKQLKQVTDSIAEIQNKVNKQTKGGVKFVNDDDVKTSKQIFTSVDAAVEKYKEFGQVKVKKIFDPATEELKSFNLEIQKTDGLIEKLKFEANQKKGINGVDGFVLTSKTEDDKRSIEMQKALTKTLEQRANLERKAAEEQAKAINSNIEKTKKHEAEQQKLNAQLQQQLKLYKEQAELNVRNLNRTHPGLADKGDLDNYLKSIKNLTTVTPDLSNKMQDLDMSFKKIKVSAQESAGAARQAGMTYKQMVTTAMEKFPIWMFSATLFYAPIRAMQDMAQRLIEIDSLLVDINRVMDVPDFKLTDMLNEAVTASDQLSSKLTDMLSVMGDFARQGFQEGELLDISKTATVLQNISDLDASGAVDTLTSAMLNYNIAAEDSIKIADQLNEVDNNFAISTKDLSDGIRKSASTAKTFGVDLQELTGYIAAIGSTTRETGAVVGNGLKTIISRLTTIDGAEATLNSVNVAMRDMEGNVRPVNEILTDLATNWSTLSEEQQQNAGVTLAGRYQLSRFYALMNNFSMAQDATATAINSTGSAMREQEKYADSLQARINRLDTAWNNLVLTTGNAFLTDGLISAIEGLNDLASVVSVVVDKFGFLPVVFGTVSASIVMLSTKLRTFSTALVFGTSEMTRAQLASAGLSAGMSRLGIATIGATTALRGLMASTIIGGAFVVLGIAIEKLISAYSNAKQAQEEFEATQQKNITALTTNKEKTDELIDSYNRLTREKENGQWNNEKEREYLQIQQQLGDSFPTLIDHIDATGQAHLKSAELIDKEIEATEKLLDLKKEEVRLNANSAFADNIDERDGFFGLEKEIQRKRDQIAQADGLVKPEVINKMKQELLSLENQFASTSMKINNEVLKVAEAYNKLEIRPEISQSVREYVNSLDLTNLNADQLESFSTRIAELTDGMQNAFNSGDLSKFGDAREYLLNYVDSMGLASESGKTLAVSFNDIQTAIANAESATYDGKDGTDALADSEYGLGDATNYATDAINGNSDAKSFNADMSSMLFGITSDQIAQMEQAINTVAVLSQMENLNAQQSGMLADATAYLSSIYPHLNGNIAQNIDWLLAETNMMSQLNSASGTNAYIMMTNQDKITASTVAASNQRIMALQNEARALQQIVNAHKAAYADEGGVAMNGFMSHIMNNRIPEVNAQLSSAYATRQEALYGGGVVERPKVGGSGGSGGGSGKKPKSGSGGKGGSGSSRQVDIYEINKYKLEMEKLNDTMEESEWRMERMDESSSEYRKELSKQSSVLKQMSAHTLGEISAIEKRNKALKSQISSLEKNKKLNNDQKERLNDLRKELESNTSEVYNLRDAWRGYQDTLKDMQDNLWGQIADTLQEEADKRVKILEDEIERVNEAYVTKIEKLEEELELMDEIEEKEDRIAALREKNDEINKEKSDKRYEYITKDGQKILTYNKQQVSELEKERDEMVKQYQRQDLKKAMQDEINNLKKQKEDTERQLRDRLDAYKRHWDNLISDAKAGTLSHSQLLKTWNDTSISSLKGHVKGTGTELNNLSGLYKTLGTIQKNMDSRAKNINSTLASNRKTANSTLSGMSKETSSSMSGLSSGANKFGGAYTGALGGINNAANSAFNTMESNANKSKKALGRTLAQLEASYNSLIKKASQYEKESGLPAEYRGIYGYYRNRIDEYHDGGIIGGLNGKETELANKMFNAKPNETIVKALKGELMIPPQNITNGFDNLRNLFSQINGNKQVGAIDNSTNVTMSGVTIKADNPQQLFDGLNALITSKG